MSERRAARGSLILLLVALSACGNDGMQVPEPVVEAELPPPMRMDEPTLRVCPTESTDTTGPQELAVIWLRHSPEPPMLTAAELENLLFGSGAVQAFFREVSFGNLCLTGRIYGPYEMPRGCNSKGTMLAMQTEILDLADPELDFSRYRRLLVIQEATCQGHANGGSTYPPNQLTRISTADGVFVGTLTTALFSANFRELVPTPGGSARPTPLTSGAGIVIHELGHALGLDHANTYDCGDRAAGVFGCRVGNYGSPFDAMSKPWVHGPSPGFDGSFPRNLNASFHYSGIGKHWLGWIPPAQAPRISTSGEYTLRPIERADAQILRIDLPDGDEDYVLETRAAIGFDAGLTDPVSASAIGGVLINRVRFDGNNRLLSLLDTTPVDADPLGADWYDAALTVGRTFVDPDRGLTVEHLGTAADGTVKVRVTLR